METYELPELKQIEKLLQQPIGQLPLPDREQVAAAEPAFREKMDAQPEEKGNKNAALHAQILKLQIADGKRLKSGQWTL